MRTVSRTTRCSSLRGPTTTPTAATGASICPDPLPRERSARRGSAGPLQQQGAAPVRERVAYGLTGQPYARQAHSWCYLHTRNPGTVSWLMSVEASRETVAPAEWPAWQRVVVNGVYPLRGLLNRSDH